MLKSIIAASAGLIFSAAAFGQNDPATKPVVFVVGPVETGSAGISSAGNPKLLGDCPGIQVSDQEAGSDYTLRMSAQDGSKSQLQVLNAAGVIVASGLAGDARNAIKDACSIVLSDFFSNGRSVQPVLAPDMPLVPVPALTSEAKVSSPGRPAPTTEPASAGFSATAIPIASQSEPAAPRVSSPSPALGTIQGTTISAPDPNASYQASEPQQAESLGEIARRNRAAKAARQQQAQQAQNDAKPNENPH